MRDLLTDEQEALLAGERYWLDHLQLELARFNAANDDRLALSQAIRQLDELFLLMSLSASPTLHRVFLEQLLGVSLSAVGLVDVARPMYLVKYGERLERVVVEPSLATIAAPAQVLRGVSLICAPEDGAALAVQLELLRRFAAQTDMVFFVLDPAAPLCSDARALLTALHDWDGYVVVVTVGDVEAPPTLRDTLLELLGRAPMWCALAESAACEDLYQSITATLREPQRLARKLQQPLDISFQIIAKYRKIINARLELLNGDYKIIEQFKEQIAAHQQALIEQSQVPFEEIRQTLQTLEQRGVEYFARALSPAKVWLALNKSRSLAAFEATVLGDLPQIIDTQTEHYLTWLAAENRLPWGLALQKLPTRVALETDPALDRIGSSFNYNRQHLLRSTIAALETGRAAYDNAREVQSLLEYLHPALATMMPAAIERAGVGAVARHMAITIMQDVLHLPTLLKVYVLPFSRTRLRQREQWKFAAMTRQLTGILEDQLYRALQVREQDIKSASAPYTRFVYEERGYLSRIGDALLSIAKWLTAIENEIKQL